MSRYIVTAGAVVAKIGDAGESYFYQGAVLPDVVTQDECKRLADTGLVAAIPDDEKPREKWTAAEVKQYAADNGYELGDATKVADLREALEKAEAARAAEAGGNTPPA